VITRKECALAGLAALAGFLGGAASRVVPVYAQERSWPKTITAEKFVAVSAAGDKRVEIGVEATGQGSLKVYDQYGWLAWSSDVQIWPAASSHR